MKYAGERPYDPNLDSWVLDWRSRLAMVGFITIIVVAAAIVFLL